MKNNNKTTQWVGHSKLKPLDTEGFSKEKVINDIQASLTGTTIKQSYEVKIDNPDLLQEAEEQKSEESNADAYVTVDAGKMNENDDNMIISMEEE